MSWETEVSQGADGPRHKARSKKEDRGWQKASFVPDKKKTSARTDIVTIVIIMYVVLKYWCVFLLLSNNSTCE